MGKKRKKKLGMKKINIVYVEFKVINLVYISYYFDECEK